MFLKTIRIGQRLLAILEPKQPRHIMEILLLSI